MSDLLIATNIITIIEARVIVHSARFEHNYDPVGSAWTTATFDRAVVANDGAELVSGGQFGTLAFGNWSWSSKSYSGEEKDSNG
jgi:hypothetical protein